jgi:F-type H+-transporting ATPase subunit epsilon
MADTLLLQLVSPERALVEEQVTDVQIPALDGFIGVLPGHAPLISELKPGGVLSYHLSAGGGEKFLAVYGGFVEVLPDRVRVLADNAQHKEEIDVNQAREELNKALAAMQNLHSEAIDPAVAVAEAMRAQAKVDTATKG